MEEARVRELMALARAACEEEILEGVAMQSPHYRPESWDTKAKWARLESALRQEPHLGQHLTDEQCDEFRRLNCSFRDMVRAIYESGRQTGMSQERALWNLSAQSQEMGEWQEPQGGMSEEEIAEVYEQSLSYALKDDDRPGVIAFARAILAAAGGRK